MVSGKALGLVLWQRVLVVRRQLLVVSKLEQMGASAPGITRA
jgi:hypothetical protein